MNRLFLIFVFVISQWSLAQEIKWYTLEEAIAAQKKNPKKIFLDVYAPWCGPCKMMDKTTFKHPEIVKAINEKYYAVKFNGEGNEIVRFKNMVFTNPNYKANVSGRNAVHEFTRHLNVTAYPTLLFFDEELNLITNLIGGFTAKDIEPYLEFFHSNSYKKVTTQKQWEDYLKKFKSNIKD